MKSLIITLAKTIPFEELNGLLIEAAEDCKKDPTQDKKSHLLTMTILIGIHLNTEGKSIMDVINDMENSAQLLRAFKSVQ